MDPQLDKTPGTPFMSQPSAEQGSPAFGGQAGAYRTPENAPIATELPPARSMPQPMGMQSTPQPMSATPISPDDNAVVVASAVTSDDDAVDQIDQEWIDKAKAIVDRTKNDPFLQSKEIEQVKADYLRIKYNKRIKVAEDKAQ